MICTIHLGKDQSSIAKSMDLGVGLRLSLQAPELDQIQYQRCNTELPLRGEVPEDEIILRLRHAIHEKYQKYESYLRDADLSENDAYVIAINSKRIRPMVLDSTLPLIVKAVFPFGNLGFSFDTRMGNVVDQRHVHRDQIVKESGNPVSTDVFLDDRYAGISAVLYSSVDVANCPPRLGADFRLVHNPIAQVPIKRASFAFGTEYWIEGDELKWTKRNENIA